MAAPVYATGTLSGIADSGSTTYETAAITPSGANRALLVYVQSSDGSPATPSAVRFGGAGGVALTRIGSVVTFGTYARGTLWHLDAEPAASAGTIHVTWPASQGERLVCAMAFADADQTTRIGTPMSGSNDTSGAPSLTGIASAVGDLIVDFAGCLNIGGGPITFTAQSGQTEHHEGATSGTAYDSAVGGTLAAASTSNTRGWNDTNGVTPNAYPWCMFSVALPQVSGGGTQANEESTPALASRRNRPGRGPYSLGRYFRQRVEAITSLIGSVFSDTISEAGSASDSVSAVVAYSATIAESASAADSFAASLAAVAAVAETGTIADSINSTLAAIAAISEAGNAQFAPTTGAAISAAIVETAAAADSVASVLNAAAALAESGSASDSYSAIASLVAALTESMSATDSVSWGGAVYSVDIVEAANATNTLTAAVNALAALAETGNATDTVSALASLQAALAEAGTALDTLTVTGVYGVSVSETGDITFTVSIDSGILPGTPSRSVTVRAANRTITVRAANRTVRVH